MRHETPRIPSSPALLKKVEELKFSTRTANCMKREDIVYVGQVARMSEPELLRIPDLGHTSLNEIKDALAQMGLHLGMKIDALAKYFKKVKELEFSFRTANCLRNDNIVYVDELVRMSEPELLRIPNLGHTSLNEIKDALAQMDLHLGMEIGAPAKNSKKIEELKISARPRHCLRNDNIVYVDELVRMSEPELLRIPNLGHTSLIEIKDALAQVGLHLGMSEPKKSVDKM